MCVASSHVALCSTGLLSRVTRIETGSFFSNIRVTAGVFEIDRETRTFWCSPEFEAIAGRRLKFEEANRPAWAVCRAG